MKSKIGFFWTPYLAARVLDDILQSGYFDVAFVVTNPDKPIGRSDELQPTPVKKLALENDIPVFTPTKIRENTELFEQLSNYNCDYFFVVAYGLILPMVILDMPKKKCINVHGSILPAYRWASPIQSVLLNGEKETGVTIMEMSKWMDEGNIIDITKISLDPTETSETLFEKFAQISWHALIEAILKLEYDEIVPYPQDHSRATYCKKIEKENGKIDWSKSAKDIYHMWQAYTPWPGIYTMYEGKRLLLEKVSLLRHSELAKNPVLPSSHSGSFVSQYDGNNIGIVMRFSDGTICVICGEWILTLNQVKLEWKKSQNIKDFVNGNQGFIWYNF